MSEELAGTTPPTRRHDIRMKLQRIRKSRRSGMLGPAEIIAFGGSVIILLTVLFSYFYFFMPARSHLQGRQLERSRLQDQLRSSNDLMRQGQGTQSTVDKITESLTNFEDNRLPNRNQGRMSLYDELNQLIRKNGLRNTSGPSYTALESLDSTRSTTGSKSASAKWQSVYPGIGVSLTVEGSYQNLRRFIRSLEASKQFIIVNALELERATETNTADSASTSGARGSLVSLRLDMATYFQRANGESGAVMQ
ncbi:MAG: type II secretion system protein M [Acidobacteriota bacterium]|nr:type II secretion system protein M [Acidobacteriota bacterium]